MISPSPNPTSPLAPEATATHIAAFGALIHRYTGHEDLDIEVGGGPQGAPLCRCRLSVSRDLPVRGLLQQVHASLAGVSAASSAWPVPEGLWVGWRESGPASRGVSLRLRTDSAGQSAGELHGQSLSPQAQSAAIQGHYESMRLAVEAGADQLVGEVPLLSEAQQQAVIGTGRGAEMPDLLRPVLLHEIFEATADRCPHNLAAVCGDRQLTYAELDRRANQLARHLRKTGVGRGKTVGLLLPRGLDVYVAMLGILKSGAAYVPLDVDYPPDRVAYILDDCKVSAVVTTADLAAKHRLDGRGPLLLDRDAALLDRQGGDRLPPALAATGDLCYVIYTSGSTGRPKGVQIEHRSASHLVLAERWIYEVGPTDRVFQGFSIAFDASVEEVWMAFASGAALVAGTAEMVHAGPALPGLLAAAGVTVWSTVPSLLSVMPEGVPSLRLLILGGESCPEGLLARWHRPERRIYNTYGPTEATVVATYTLYEPGRPLTIGKPIPNYRLYVLDALLQPVPQGMAGELCIGGVGLSRGYLGRDDLTAEAFKADPFAPGLPHARLYRTGDLARLAADGQVEYLGRIDTQVKIRGFRVELSEIESVLMQHPEIQTAVAALWGEAGAQHLVGYVVPQAGRTLDEDAVRGWLRTRLPAYMIPSLLEPVADLHRLASGKVDRKRLPAPRPRTARAPSGAGPAMSPLEESLAEVWRELLAPLPVAPTDDFFLDLGGHSLLAARMVSQLRKEPEFADLSVLDVYSFPTVRSLAAELETRRDRREASAPTEPAARKPAPKATSRLGYGLCVAAQTVSLLFVAGLFSMQWLTPYLAYCWLTERGTGIIEAIAISLSVLLVFYPLLIVVSVAVKWTVIGRFRAGTYPLWGWYYFRWWFVTQVMSVVPIDDLAGTPLLSWYYRLMGARIGKNVYLGSDNVGSFDLVSIGDNCSFGSETMLMGYSVEDGVLRLGPITVGRGCFVGARAALRPHTVMEDGARLEDLSLLSEGGRIPAGQTWIGSPARPMWRSEGVPQPVAPAAPPSRLRLAAFALLHALGVLLVPAVCLIALFPGLIWLNYATREYGGYWFLALAPVVTVIFVLLMALEIVLAKWLVLGRARPGTYSVYSSFYLRKWFFDQLMDLSLDLLGPLYATLYLAPWLRMLGAKLGRRAEISTASDTSPDLLELGEESFIADAVSLGACRVDGGRIVVAATRVGKRAFVGNSAFVPAGAAIGDEVLIGCLSAPPLSPADAARRGTSWLGSPSFFLPQRQGSTAFSAEQTFRPTRRLVGLRAFIEFFRITLPTTCFVFLTSLLITIVISLREYLSLGELVLVFPVLYVAFGVGAALIVVACKWILMGRYRPAEKPLWSSFVWRTELLTAMHENLADPFLVMLLLGTPWVGWFFRLLGAHVGRRVFFETTCLTEFDLITIGDRAMLGSECTLQTHLFEDRVMKMSTIDIGAGCSVGAGSIVLYDTRMEPGSVLGDVSLLMKGENLPHDTQWEGTPARPLLSGAMGTAQAELGVAGTRAPLRVAAEQAATQVDYVFGFDEYNARAAGPWVWVLDVRDGRPVAADPVAADRQQGRDLVRQVLGAHLDLRPDEVALGVDAQGAPTLAPDRMSACPRAADLRLSVSHCDHVLAAGVSFTGPVGVDVEIVRPEFDLASLAGSHLTAGEWQRLQSLPADQQTLGFYKLWTAKEAMVKAVRQGLFFGLDQVELALDPDGSVRLTSLSGQAGRAQGWRISHRSMTVGGLPVIAAVATGEA